MGSDSAVAGESETIPVEGLKVKRSSRDKKHFLAISLQHHTEGAAELIFEGSMTKPFLHSSWFAINGIMNSKIQTVYIDCAELKMIDERGITFLNELLAKLKRLGITFQLIYQSGRVGSQIESSAIIEHMSNPSWVHG